MRRALLAVLASPCCNSALTLSEEIGDGVWEHGELHCSVCSRSFPVRDGVPDLVLDRPRIGQQRSFAYQWSSRFRGAAEPEHLLWGKDHSSLPYKLRSSGCYYLDMGCGPGEIIRRVALENPDVQAVGADITDCVFRAQRRNRDVPNLHFVRADALTPAFKSESFRYILALGVLHHTGDTRRALLAVLRLLQKSGTASIWLYPNEADLRASAARREYRKWKRYYFIRDRLLIGKSHKLSPAALAFLCAVLSALLSPLGHLLELEVPNRRQLYRSNRLLLFDNLAPRWQDRPPKTEVMSWLRDAGYSKVLHSFDRGGLYTVLRTK